jgi:hypothetical protein
LRGDGCGERSDEQRGRGGDELHDEKFPDCEGVNAACDRAFRALREKPAAGKAIAPARDAP